MMFSCADAKLLCRCQELVTENLFGNPQIANKSFLVTVTSESESEDEEYNLPPTTRKMKTCSNRVASHTCSSDASGASAPACTGVVSILGTLLN